MGFDNRVLTTSQDKIAASVVDTVLNGNVFATKMLGNAKPWIGEKMKFPVKLSKNTNGSSFSGLDTFSTSAVSTRQNLSYDPKFYSINVTLPLTEISANKSMPTMDLMNLEVQSSAQDMSDDIGTLFYSDGTGNSSKDFLGLEAIVDDGTNAATIGGLSRSTNTTLQSTVTASGGTLTLAKVSTLLSNITSGSTKPTLGLCSETVWDFIEKLIDTESRIVKEPKIMTSGIAANSGFTSIHYRGVPIIADEKATAQTLYFVNENFIEWRALPVAKTTPVKFIAQDIKGNDLSGVKGLGFSWSGFIMSQNQAAITGHIYLGGELVTTNPKRHGKLTGITSA